MNRIYLFCFIFSFFIGSFLYGGSSISSGLVRESKGSDSIIFTSNRMIDYNNYFLYNDGIFATVITPHIIVAPMGNNSLLSLLSNSALTNPSFRIDSKVFAFEPKSSFSSAPYRFQDNFAILLKNCIDYHKLKCNYAFLYQVESDTSQYGFISSVELNRLQNLFSAKNPIKKKGGYAFSCSLGYNLIYNHNQTNSLNALKNDSWFFSKPTTLANSINAFLCCVKGEWNNSSITSALSVTTNGTITNGIALVAFVQHQGGFVNRNGNVVLFNCMGGIKGVSSYWLKKSGEGTNSYFDFFAKSEISIGSSSFLNLYYGHRLYTKPSEVALYFPTIDRFNIQFIYRSGRYSFDCNLRGDFEVDNCGILSCQLVPALASKFQIPTFFENQKIQIEIKNSYDIKPLKRLAVSKFEVGLHSTLHKVVLDITGRCSIYTVEWKECYKVVPQATISLSVPIKRGKLSFFFCIDKMKKESSLLDGIFYLDRKSYGSYDYRI